MTRVADTSALYALFNQEDIHHDTAREEVAKKEPIAVPLSILVETVDLLGYRHSTAVAREASRVLLEFPHLRIAEQVHVEPVLMLHDEARGELSLADSIVVQTCRVLGATPLTFDRAIEHWCARKAS